MTQPLTRNDLVEVLKSFPTKDDLRHALNDRFDHYEQRAVAREEKNHQEIMGAFAHVLDTMNDERDRELAALRTLVSQLAELTGNADLAVPLHRPLGT